jgi:hypothetical protein
MYAIIPGQEYPSKPRVAEVFKDEQEDEMDDRIRGLVKKRKVPKARLANFHCNQLSFI